MFHADGTGTGNAVNTGAQSAGSDEVSFQFTYTIGQDGKLTVTLVPGTYLSTITSGLNAGLTAVEEVPVQTGLIGEGARMTVLGEAAPGVETVTLSNGNQFAKICTRSRTLHRISDDDH